MHGAVRRDGDVFHVFTGGRHFALAYNDPMAHAGEAEAAGGRLTAPMPGKVVAVLAKAGQEVKKGDAARHHGSDEDGAHHRRAVATAWSRKCCTRSATRWPTARRCWRSRRRKKTAHAHPPAPRRRRHRTLGARLRRAAARSRSRGVAGGRSDRAVRLRGAVDAAGRPAGRPGAREGDLPDRRRRRRDPQVSATRCRRCRSSASATPAWRSRWPNTWRTAVLRYFRRFDEYEKQARARRLGAAAAAPQGRFFGRRDGHGRARHAHDRGAGAVRLPGARLEPHAKDRSTASQCFSGADGAGRLPARHAGAGLHAAADARHRPTCSTARACRCCRRAPT